MKLHGGWKGCERHISCLVINISRQHDYKFSPAKGINVVETVKFESFLIFPRQTTYFCLKITKWLELLWSIALALALHLLRMNNICSKAVKHIKHIRMNLSMLCLLYDQKCYNVYFNFHFQKKCYTDNNACEFKNEHFGWCYVKNFR